MIPALWCGCAFGGVLAIMGQPGSVLRAIGCAVLLITFLATFSMLAVRDP